jgi:hypothetical protein
MWKIKRFIRRIKNLIRWLPTIWKDEQWDDHFIWEILKFKLKNQAEYIGKKNRHLSAKRDAEIMMLCVRLIEKVQSEYYGMEYHEYYESNIKFVPSISHPGSYEMEEELISEHYDDYFKKYPLIYKRVMNGEGVFKREGRKDDKQIIAMNISHINHDRARKLLFKMMEENIEKWWD